ncbi:SpoIIE family protein phosphatase [Leptospira sp. GIMC2001]|uniref:SpoIIE family protein phosphatase n=1 Tax=Leptospira sp. GIMC2001 TaxID=1513297 RepID=UPI00234AD4E3|nr:SpoIIE family protein phosphatase [Leptospira sp. GIMC2001]WCL50174.1 SpoIIE family protein phosphatase [Leptospira sp. GIMC2001]
MNIQLTFFSLGSLIVCIFTAVLASFLFKIRDRSSSSTYLGLSFLFFSIHASSFVLAYSVNHPIAAYHRWLVLFVIPGFLCMGQFFYNYPSPIHKRSSQIFFITQLVLWFILLGYYINSTLGLDPIFDRSEQIWTFPNAKENKVLGFCILIFSFVMLTTGIWRSIQNQGMYRRVTIYFIIFFSFLIFPPVIANSLTRAGIIMRSDFLSVYTFCMTIGSFIILVLYINTTKDRTNFLNRITGICLGTFWLLFYSVILISVEKFELLFDERNLAISQSIVHNRKLSEDSVYLIKYSDNSPLTNAFQYVELDSKLELEFFESLLNSDSTNPLTQAKIFDSSRLLRLDHNGNPSVLAYRVKNSSSKEIYEVGYPYIKYRDFLHERILPYILILFASLIIVLIGFRWFFKGAIWIPLKNLLSGIDKVNSGDMGIQVPVRIYDEIGYLTSSFNGMISSIREAKTALSVYAETLEEQVKERTHQLTQSLNQQQGDYFLTSLLLKPFLTANIQTDKVHLEFLTQQMKKFQFKNQTHEIGGDLSMATNLKIGSSNCIVFINADAMGKSIQGAGGALVLGSLFGSIINRTQIYKNQLSNITPDRWIKTTFLEIAKVFDIFQGSMLVTAILGVIDEDSGKLYMVNAEHPNPVIYRNGKARFLEFNHLYRRLGMHFDATSPFLVKTFQLVSGDMIFIGSDGKDDLEIGNTNDGIRVINDGEEVFLEHVEKSKGDLDEIYGSIKSFGNITDDLSIVRIKYI